MPKMSRNYSYYKSAIVYALSSSTTASLCDDEFEAKKKSVFVKVVVHVIVGQLL